MWESMKKAAPHSGSGGKCIEKPPELIPGGVVRIRLKLRFREHITPLSHIFGVPHLDNLAAFLAGGENICGGDPLDAREATKQINRGIYL